MPPINTKYTPIIALGAVGAVGVLLYFGKRWVEKLVQKTADRAADRAVDRAVAKVPPSAIANTIKELQKTLAPHSAQPVTTDTLNQAISQGLALAQGLAPKRQHEKA